MKGLKVAMTDLVHDEPGSEGFHESDKDCDAVAVIGGKRC